MVAWFGHGLDLDTVSKFKSKPDPCTQRQQKTCSSFTAVKNREHLLGVLCIIYGNINSDYGLNRNEHSDNKTNDSDNNGITRLLTFHAKTLHSKTKFTKLVLTCLASFVARKLKHPGRSDIKSDISGLKYCGEFCVHI